jgi:hypothetical protein
VVAPTISGREEGLAESTTDKIAVETEAVRAGSAERMRRCRARRRAGFHCFTVELHRSEIDALVRRGLLSADEREDEGAVVDALGQHIEETLGPPW